MKHARARREAFRDAPVRAGIVEQKKKEKKREKRTKRVLNICGGRGEEGTFLLSVQKRKKRKKKTPTGVLHRFPRRPVGIRRLEKKKKRKR